MKEYKTKKDRKLDYIFERYTSKFDNSRFLVTLSCIRTMKQEIVELYCPQRSKQ